MTSLTICIGQCGNQIGSQLINAMYNSCDSRKEWFDQTTDCDYARSVLVDTESKVVDSLLKTTYSWKFKKENIIFTSGGSGSNWALGYYVNSQLLKNDVVEAIRHESENSDYVRTITCFLSSGGGTGSGVGTYIIEKLRDIFPKKYIICNLVIPSTMNETCVYSYNTVLSLTKLNDECDAIVTFYNDILHKQCKYLYKDSEFNLQDLNSIVAKQLSSLFSSYNQTYFIPHHFNKVVPLNSYKLLSLKSCPYMKEKLEKFEAPMPWKYLIDRLKAMLTKNDDFWNCQHLNKVFTGSRQNISYYRSIGNILTCNGKGASLAMNYATNCFKSDVLYSPVSSISDRFAFLSSDENICNQPQFSSIITNSGIFSSRLNTIVEKAWFSYSKNAYCHHYLKHGLQDKEFTYGFLKIETILKLYSSL